MSLSNDINQYEDVRPHLDRALSSTNGIRVTCSTKGQAIHLRQRLYKLRALSKEASIEMFDVGDPRRGFSSWEDLAIAVVDNAVLITHRPPLVVEDL